MKLNEQIKYEKDNYYIYGIYGIACNVIYLVMKDIKIFIRCYSTLKEAIEYINNL